MEGKICSFFGHKKVVITIDLKNKLLSQIEKLINNGYTIFYFGGFSQFDELAYNIVTMLKTKYDKIKRVLCLTNRKYLQESKRISVFNSNQYDDYIYLELDFDWWYQRIYFRNCKMIENNDFVIFYVEHKSNSGAYKALQFAIKQKKNYVNLFI